MVIKRHNKAHSILNLWGIKVKITIEEPSFSSCTLFQILVLEVPEKENRKELVHFDWVGNFCQF